MLVGLITRRTRTSKVIRLACLRKICVGCRTIPLLVAVRSNRILIRILVGSLCVTVCIEPCGVTRDLTVVLGWARLVAYSLELVLGVAHTLWESLAIEKLCGGVVATYDALLLQFAHLIFASLVLSGLDSRRLLDLLDL